MRIGVVSDTYGLYDPQLAEIFAGCDRIFHAGDIGRDDVLQSLEKIAPVTAIRGNIDMGRPTARFPDWVLRTIEDHRILMLHDLSKPAHPTPVASRLITSQNPHLIIAGHSHKPGLSHFEGRLYLNPGSAGRKRFQLERAVATLEFGSALRVRVHSLERSRLLFENWLG